MGRSSVFTRTILALDTFREIPADLTEPSFLGALFTMGALALCAALFVCETLSFLTSK